MMGDSRNNSADSRVADHGPVPVDNVIGKARLIVLPFARFGRIDAIDPQSTAVGLAAPDRRAVRRRPLALGLLGALPCSPPGRVRRREADRCVPARLSCDPAVRAVSRRRPEAAPDAC